MNTFLYFSRTLFGTTQRKSDDNNYIELYSWPQSDRNLGGHISMLLVCNGKRHYISYWHQRDYKESQKKAASQWAGSEPFWVNSYQEDCWIEGFRHQQKTNPQKNAKEILEIVNTQDSHERALQKPDCLIRLNTLDTEKMLASLTCYQKKNHHWGAFAGLNLHAKGTHNCASLIFHLLSEGGIQKMVSSLSESYSTLALAITCCAYFALPVTTLTAITAYLGGSVLGGALDGLTDIQSIQHVIDIEKGPSCLRRTAINITAMLISGLGSTIRSHPIPRLLTMPDSVMRMAQAAHHFEHRCYRFTKAASNTSPAINP